MKLRVLKLLFTGAVFALGAMGQNSGTTQRFTFNLEGTALAGCNGEIIDLTGQVHTVVHLSSTKNGQLSAFMHSNYRHVSGVGADTGATYVGSDSFHTHMIVTPDGHTVYTSEESVHLISRGNQVPDTIGVIVLHMVAHPDGTVTANIDQVHSSCH